MESINEKFEMKKELFFLGCILDDILNDRRKFWSAADVFVSISERLVKFNQLHRGPFIRALF